MLGRVSRVTLLAASAGAVAALAAGCTGTSGSSSPAASGSPAASSPGSAQGSPAQHALLLAAHNSQQVNSLDSTLDIQATTAGGDLAMTGTLQERIRPTVLAEMSVPGFTVGGQSMPGGLDEIISPSAIYLKMSAITQELHTAKPWAELPLSSLGSTGASLQSMLNQVQSSNPVAQTQLLASSKDVRKVGTATIDGVAVTEYAGSYTMSQALAALPASEQAALSKQIDTAGIKTAQFKVWIDGQSLTRRLIVTETGTNLHTVSTINVTSYNQPVSIQPPPYAQVYVVPAGQPGGGTS